GAARDDPVEDGAGVPDRGPRSHSHLQTRPAAGCAAPDPRSRRRVQGAPSGAVRADAEGRRTDGMSETDDIETPQGDGPVQPERPAEETPERPRMELGQLKGLVEALVFASPEPLTPKMLFKLLSDEPREDVTAAVAALKEDYRDRPGLQLAEVAGGLQITTRPELHEWVRRLFHERTTQKLSVASLETLSVVAY